MLLFVTIDTTIREGGGRSEGPDAQCKGNTRFIQYMKQIHTRQKGKLNWGATTLVGHPPGRLPGLYQNHKLRKQTGGLRKQNRGATSPVGHPSGSLPHW